MNNNPWANQQAPYFDPYGVFARAYQQQTSAPQTGASPQPPEHQGPKIIYRPVCGIEEARAAQVDWDGSMLLMDDAASGTLYRKQYADGSVRFAAYKQVEISEPQPVAYASAAELDALRAQISEMEKRLASPPKGTKKDD